VNSRHKSSSDTDPADTAGDAAAGWRIVGSVCGTGTCPTIYESEGGSLIVQGYPVDPARAGLTVPDGESLVEIPAELLASLQEVTS